MSDPAVFILCIFGIVVILVWWIVTLLMKTEYGRLRERLRVDEAGAGSTKSTTAVTELIQRVGQAAATPFMPKTREAQSAIRRQLGQAGIYAPSAVRLVIGCKVLLLAAGLVGGYFAGATLDNTWLGLSLGGLLAYTLPSLWLKLRIREQHSALQRGLPDALDLLVVCIEAGLTVDAAMQRVGQELSLAHPRLARELELTHMETRIGLARSDAMRNLGQRTGSPALQAVATMLIQAERFGTSVAAALRVEAETLRTKRQHIAEEQAAKASVKLTFPVVLFIFPAVLIVLAGPAVIGLLKSSLLGN